MNTEKNIIQRNSTSGFSLIEISLAILVAAIGLLTVMAIFPVGLKMSQKSTEELQFAMFAQQVFDGFQAYSDFTPWGSLDTATLEAVAYGEWINFNTLEVSAGGGVLPLNYTSFDDVAANQFEQYAFRYDLNIVDSGAGTKTIQLRVLPRYGTENAQEFYTEIFYKGVN